MQQYNSLVLQRERFSLTVKDNNPIATNLNTQIKNVRGDLIKSLESQQKALQISEDKLVQQNNQLPGPYKMFLFRKGNMLICQGKKR